MEIEVVYATAETQKIVQLDLPEGACVRDAVIASELHLTTPAIEVDVTPVGIYAERVQYDTLLRDGDRVEIYRPLLLDPMQARRQRARSQVAKMQTGKTTAGRK